MRGSIVDVQFPKAENRRGKKERKKKPQDENTIALKPLSHRAAIIIQSQRRYVPIAVATPAANGVT